MAPTAGPVAPATQEPVAVVGHEDYALTRVPAAARYSWWSVAVQRFGQLSALAQFFLAASIGIGMSFWDAVLAITIGSVLLEVVTIFVGIAGMREGMSTSLLARWTGFGRRGSALVGVAMAVSLVGWFGVQNQIFATGLQSIVPGVPFWLLCVVGGMAVTAIVVFGFSSMAWVAYVTVPAFLLLALWSVGSELSRHSLSELVSSPPPGEPISLAVATTIVAGGFIVGAVMTPDMTRFNRSVGDVVKQTVVGVTLGEYVIGLSGVLLAHAVRISDQADAGLVIGIVQSTSGVIGVLILVVSILKINDWNLYPSSLGLVNAADALFRVRLSRPLVAVALGVVGSVLSAIGIADHFQGFLSQLGVVFPPIAAIMIAEYFVVRTWRRELEASRVTGTLPERSPEWVPAGLIAWVAGIAVGEFVTVGVPSINALLAAFVVYAAVGTLLRRRATV